MLQRDTYSILHQVNEGMQREMLEVQLAAQQAEAAALKGRLDSTLSELVAAATPSNPKLLHILKVPCGNTRPVGPRHNPCLTTALVPLIAVLFAHLCEPLAVLFEVQLWFRAR